MLQTQAVESSTLELLRRLQQVPELLNTRLVGGTALALHLGHRHSYDIDLFGEISHQDITLVLNEIEFDSFVVNQNFRNLKHYSINDVKVDMVNYNYKWIEAGIEEEGYRIAGMKDISAMKLHAITGRGSKKDFIDLHFLLKEFSMKEMLDFYTEKYPDHSFFMLVKSLTYFEDAEIQEMPLMYKQVHWTKIKNQICNEVENL
jgi:hypothetical protein